MTTSDNKMDRRRFLKTSGLLLGGAAVSPLWPNWASAQELARQQVIRYASNHEDIKSMDPVAETNSEEYMISRLMHEGLVAFPAGHDFALDDLQPGLAERWETSQDGKTWTFSLRSGVVFHKGQGEFTAEDVKFTYDRIRDPKLGSSHRGRYANIQEVRILDKKTVRFTLASLDILFLYKLAPYQGGQIVCKKAASDSLGSNLPLNPIGTGPFQLKEYRSKERIIFEPHNGYWKGKPIIQRIEMIFTPDFNTRVLALLKREVEAAWYSEVKQPIYERLIKSGLIGDTWAPPNTSAMHFNLTRKPFDDLRVRQALAYAIDQEKIAKGLMGDLGIPIYSLIPPSAGGLKKEEIPEEFRYPYNPEKARALLRQAGFANGLSIETMMATTIGNWYQVLQAIQEQWRQVGVDLKVQLVDNTTYLDTFRKKDTLAVAYYGGNRGPEPDTFLREFFHSKSIVTKPTGQANVSHYGDIVGNIDSLIDQASSTLDAKKRSTLYRQAQLQLLKDLPAYPITNSKALLARVPTLDLGFKFVDNVSNSYIFNEKTRLLKS